MKLIENKIALVTGASRGIGRCTALTFAENGADVIFTDLKENEDSVSLAKEIADMGRRCSFFAVNASDYDAVQEMAAKVQKDFGRLDILVNNAGITRDNLMLRMTPQDWDLVLTINLKSVFNNSKAFIPMMIKQRSGSIINLSSIVGINGNAGQANYSASKAGIIGLTRSIAKEMGSRSIRCNAIAPGFIETPMTAQLPEDVRKEWMTKIPLRRGGKDKDVAKLALFLASDLSEYITGQVLRCDGGLSLGN
ncbi:MAG: 3-oxoacyl-[acyl-carrier-protein] reductase [Bacteroidales bacterium]|nr:3-oxoacyl-[acyl-carrier-protein] reductase [Bacteroidales bacterium]